MRAIHAVSAAVALFLCGAVQAQAATTISLQTDDQPLPTGQVMLIDFDGTVAPGVTFTQGTGAFVRDGDLGLWDSVSAPPPGDTTNYETVTSGGVATLSLARALKVFSLYMGSPDSYNTIRFFGENGFTQTFSGDAIFGGVRPANGDQNWGRRISYDFGAERVNRVEFLSSGNSFEFDSLAGQVAAVPEPATWAMMLLGFFGVGSSLRSRRMREQPAVA